MLNESGKFMYFNMNSLNASAGDCIKGELYIKLPNNEYSNSVVLKLSGIESSHFEGHHIVSTILSEEIILYKWPENLASRGDYIFPFEIFLPKKIPGSTHLEILGLSACVEYKIEAFMSEDLKITQEVSVKSYQDFPNCQNCSECIVDVKSCCCIKVGTVDLVVKSNKFAYTSSEVIKLKIEGLCRLVPRVRVSLVRSVLVTAESGDSFMSKTTVLEIVGSEATLDIDLKSIENRLKMQCSTKASSISCSYSINILGEVAALCHNEEAQVILWIVINPVATATLIPKYSVSWKPIYMNGIKISANANERIDNF